MNRTYMLGHKKIGELEGDTFFKEVLRSKHLFRVLDAWGIDSKTLNGLPANTKIVIHELEEDKWYRTTKEDYLEHGQYYHFKNEKVDNRTQLFLKRARFKIEELNKLESEELNKHN